MFRISSLLRSGAPLALSAKRRLAAAVLPCVVAFGIPAMVTWAAHGHAAAPGLTGADRPDDVVQARQLLMATIPRFAAMTTASVRVRAPNRECMPDKWI